MALTSKSIPAKVQFGDVYIETSFVFIQPMFINNGCEVQLALYKDKDIFNKNGIPTFTYNLGSIDLSISDDNISETLHSFVQEYLNKNSFDTWIICSGRKDEI